MAKALYKDVEYFVISTQGDMIELAPTAHGAGSFIVHKDFTEPASRVLVEEQDVVEVI